MLQSDAVVFVEGRTERKVLPVFAEKLDFQFNNVAIVPLEGGSPGKSEKIAIKVLDSFKIPYLFLIDSHGEPKESRRGEYMDKINLDDEDAWWEVEPEDFHVWSKYGIESYLVDSPEAIAKNLGEEDHVERLQEMIDEESGDMTPAIEKIYGEFGLEYDKVNDGRQIARHMTEDDLDDEVERVIRKVENLI
jgi:predicted ATP-dependent endonuclease of OLD family